MNVVDYKTFYDTVGAINGWDFSSIKCVSEPAPWDFYSEVASKCRTSDRLLDIGTGGGEALLALADAAQLLVGIDQSAGMIATASRNLAASGLTHVHFVQMASEQLAFAADSFNIVSCRHAPFSAGEITKVLVSGGYFLTQQIAEQDKRNLGQAFGRGQSYQKVPGALKQQYLSDLESAGFRSLQAFDYDITEYYETAEDLLFLLKHTPIIPGFGNNPADFEVLQSFIEENRREQGIMTNSARFMIIAQL